MKKYNNTVAGFMLEAYDTKKDVTKWASFDSVHTHIDTIENSINNAIQGFYTNSCIYMQDTLKGRRPDDSIYKSFRRCLEAMEVDNFKITPERVKYFASLAVKIAKVNGYTTIVSVKPETFINRFMNVFVIMANMSSIMTATEYNIVMSYEGAQKASKKASKRIEELKEQVAGYERTIRMLRSRMKSGEGMDVAIEAIDAERTRVSVTLNGWYSKKVDALEVVDMLEVSYYKILKRYGLA